MPRLVERPWFGPRRLPGYGWSPVTWQGWAVSVGFFAAILLCAFLIPNVVIKVIAEVVLVVLLVTTCALTGTRPGGKRWW